MAKQERTAAEAVAAAAQPAAAASTADNSAALQARVDELSDALANANRDKADLQAQIDQHVSDQGELAGELNEAQDLIADLQRRLDDSALIQAESGTVIVTDGTDHYKVLAPKFQHKRVEYTAEELRDNEPLVQELVAAGIGFLQKIEKK